MPIHRLMPNVRQVIRDKDLNLLPNLLQGRKPVDLADMMTDLKPSEQVLVLHSLDRAVAQETFQHLLPSTQNHILEILSAEEAAALLDTMTPDDRTLLLEEAPPESSEQLMQLLSPEKRVESESLLKYPEDSVGRLMTPRYLAVSPGWTVAQVFDFVRRHGAQSETLNVIYVVDEQGRLMDDIRMGQFLLAPLQARVSDLTDGRFVALDASADRETAVDVFMREDRTALPVVSTDGILLGIITVDDVLDVAADEATEDIHKIGGVQALEEPYMQIGLIQMVRKRAGWLTLLFLGEMLTATAMGYFEQEIARAVVLALFIPLIISSGGNSGSQAATLVIRALALQQLELRDWWRVLHREALAGLTLGGILGAIGFLRIVLWSAYSDLYGPHWLLVAVTVATALVGVVLWGTLTGSLLPFLLRRLGFDPATSSAPFVATLVDVSGLILYFSIAALILKGALL
ncbi:MAG: magnesium transporter [Acidobacteriota bacterium]